MSEVIRKSKGNSEVVEVMGEKYCFLFQSTFSIGPESVTVSVNMCVIVGKIKVHQHHRDRNMDVLFQIYCSSLPCVIYTHASYIADGWKTLFWENSFRRRNRVPFDVPVRIPWPAMASALNKFIKERTKTTRNLSPANVAYLKKKFGFLFANGQEYVAKTDFEETLNPNKMTLWHYIYSITELIRKYLRTEWDEG